jgi:hypothetical protein
MGALWRIELSKNREHRAGLEPALPRYECGVLAAGRPVPANVMSMGPEGLEPSPTWLRARHAATSTLIPYCLCLRFSPYVQSARRELNSRPVSYKDTALTTELRAGNCQSNRISGAEGSRTLTIPLKRRKRYHYATTPKLELGVCV